MQKKTTKKGNKLEWLQSIIIGIITGMFSAGSIWGILTTKITHLEQDVQNAHKRITHHEDIHHHPKARA